METQFKKTQIEPLISLKLIRCLTIHQEQGLLFFSSLMRFHSAALKIPYPKNKRISIKLQKR